MPTDAVVDAPGAAQNRPEISIETDDLDAVLVDVSAPGRIYCAPTCRRRGPGSGGAREFALLDATHVCVVLREWAES